MRPHLNITGKLVLFVVGLLLVKGLLTIVWVSGQMHNELVSRELDDLAHDVRLASLDLSQHIDEVRRRALALTDVPPIQGIIRARDNDGTDPADDSTDEQWRYRLESIFRSILSANPDILQLRYIGVADDGLELVRVDRESAGSPIRVVPASGLQQKGSREYLQDSFRATVGTVLLSKIELNREFGRVSEPHQPVIRAVTPIYDESGSLFGAIVLNYDMGAAFARATRDLPPSRSFYIANRDGDFLVHPDPSLTFGFDLGRRHRVVDEFPDLDLDARSMHQEHQATGVLQTRQGKRLAIAYEQESINPLNPSRDLFLLTTTDYATLVSAPNRLIRTTVIGALGFLAIAIAIGTLVARRFSKPIRELARTAARIADGELGARARVRATDEVGELSEAFNGMAESLQLKQEALEDRAAGLETRMAAIVNTAIDAIITTREDGTIESCNPATEMVFGHRAADIIGRPIGAIIPSIETFARRGNRNRELFGSRPDGSLFPIDLSINEVRLDDEVLFTGIARDISETRRIHKALREAKEGADAANLAKSDFLAVMSHELRTPLNGVIGMTELLLGTELNDKQRHHATLAKLSADTLLSLINDILDFSKIEAGKVELEAIDFDLRQAVEAVATSIAPRAEEKGLELVAFVDPRLNPMRCGDPGRIQQVLLNLASNAIKFTESGEVVIEVRPERQAGRDPHIRVSIHDTGIGIPPDRVDALFHPFAQVDASTTRKFGGTGLGLAICRHLVELMDGEIGVESSPGNGSTFWFTCRLPCQDEASHERQEPDLSGSRVLVVDDNETNRTLLCEHLAALGIEHAAASGPEEALRVLAEHSRLNHPFSVAFLDMNMPGMNGVELARAIKADPEIDSVALILLGSSTAMDGELLSSVGFRCWLSKPIRQSQVTEYIERATAPVEAATAHIPEPVEPESETDLEGVLVLVAEDDAVSREVVSCLLNEAGCVYTAAPNGRIALDEALTGRFDVALLDCQMPEMDGFEAVRHIREHEAMSGGLSRRGTRLPIAALTANAVKGDRERCIAAGMDNYLAKPLTTKRLYDMLHLLLRLGADSEAPLEKDPEPVTRADTPEIDVEELLTRWVGMHDLVHRVLTRFETQAPEAIAGLESAVADADADRTRELAHTLKGAAGYAGAHRVQQVAATLERLGEQARMDTAIDELQTLREAVERCIEALPGAHRLVDQASRSPPPAEPGSDQ